MKFRPRAFVVLAIVAHLLVLNVSPASAGNYVVAECSPGLNPGAPDVGYTYSTNHYQPRIDCSQGAPGLSVVHGLGPGETGTVQGAFGAWIFTAPPGTYIVGGSVFSRLATESGQHGYLAVSPDAGASTAFAVQNDNQGHETGIPVGNWRFLVLRLECTQPNEGNRCAGPAPGALASVKQVRIALADVSQPTLKDGGSLFSGTELRGPQTVDVGAADQGAGLQSIQIIVNGKGVAGDDLSASCNPLPGGLTARMAPCPPTVDQDLHARNCPGAFQGGPEHGRGMRLRLRPDRHSQRGLHLTRSPREQSLPRFPGCRREDDHGGIRREQGQGKDALIPPQSADPGAADRRQWTARRQRPGLHPGPHRSSRSPLPPCRDHDDQPERGLVVQNEPRAVAHPPSRLSLGRFRGRGDPGAADSLALDPPPQHASNSIPQEGLFLRRTPRPELRWEDRLREDDRSRRDAKDPRSTGNHGCFVSLSHRLRLREDLGLREVRRLGLRA